MSNDAAQQPPLLNLAPNASPLTHVTFELIRRSAQDGFDPRICRIRDSWLSTVDGKACATLFINLGGDLRGGPNAALWHRLRHHPWFLSDMDSPNIQDHASATFAIGDAEVSAAADELIAHVPATTVHPDQKLFDAQARALEREVPNYQADVSHEQVQLLCAGFVAAVLKYGMAQPLHGEQ